MANEVEDKIGSLDDEALKRKERLKALKQGNVKTLTASRSDEDGNNLESFPKPIFRNYTPKTEELKASVLPKPKLIEIENEVKEQLESGKPAPLIENEIDLTTLAPQKVDWDLKRDAEKRLRVLEKRTQKAIVELIKDRLKTKKNADLAELVSLGTQNINLNKEAKDGSADGQESESDEETEEVRNEYSEPSSPFEINTKTEISDDDDY